MEHFGKNYLYELSTVSLSLLKSVTFYKLKFDLSCHLKMFFSKFRTRICTTKRESASLEFHDDGHSVGRTFGRKRARDGELSLFHFRNCAFCKNMIPTTTILTSPRDVYYNILTPPSEDMLTCFLYLWFIFFRATKCTTPPTQACTCHNGNPSLWTTTSSRPSPS